PLNIYLYPTRRSSDLVNYGRLREACQTSVDGTSITMMDEIGKFLGLDCEEMMLPADHLLLPEAGALPAIVVTRTPNGNNHFVVVDRKSVVEGTDGTSG